MPVTVAEKTRFKLRIHLDLPSPAERRRLRKASGLSQSELANIVGVTRQAISQYESGARLVPRNPEVRERYVVALRTLREVA